MWLIEDLGSDPHRIHVYNYESETLLFTAKNIGTKKVENSKLKVKFQTVSGDP
jgi:hypothetical protein